MVLYLNNLIKMQRMSNFKVVNALVKKSWWNNNRAVQEWPKLASVYAALLGNWTQNPVTQRMYCLILSNCYYKQYCGVLRISFSGNQTESNLGRECGRRFVLGCVYISSFIHCVWGINDSYCRGYVYVI